MKLWIRATDMDASQQGPAVAGRLSGRPFNLAMGLRVVDQAGVSHIGDSALAFPGEAVQYDQLGNAVAPETRSGLQALMRLLTSWYGEDEDTTVGTTLDTFFDLRRGKMSLAGSVAIL